MGLCCVKEQGHSTPDKHAKDASLSDRDHYLQNIKGRKQNLGMSYSINVTALALCSLPFYAVPLVTPYYIWRVLFFFCSLLYKTYFVSSFQL